VNIKDLLQLLRIHNVLGSSLGAITGFLIASNWALDKLQNLILSAIIVGLTSAGGYVVNDIYDIEIDKINKPNRPLPSGRIGIKEAWYITLISFIASIILSFFLNNILLIIITLLVIISLYLYAKEIKRSGFWGNLIVATDSALVFLYGALSYTQDFSKVLPSIVPFLYSFLLTISREIIKGIEDYHGDKAHNVMTLPVRLGIVRAWRLSKIMLIFIILISPLPIIIFHFNIFYLILVLIVDLFILLVILSKEDISSASRARGYLKVSALVGIFAFLLGSLPL